MNTFRITFTTGDVIVTSMNASLQKATEYYTNNYFNFGDTQEHPADKMGRGVSVVQLNREVCPDCGGPVDDNQYPCCKDCFVDKMQKEDDD